MEYLKGSYSMSNTQATSHVAQGSPVTATRGLGDPRDPWLRDSPRHTLPVAREKPKNRKTEKKNVKLKNRKTKDRKTNVH